MSRPRRLLVIVVGLCLVAGTLWWIARSYLSSQQVAAQAAARLQALYGAPVRLREANVGLRGSSLHDLQFFEADASSAQEPWLVIENAHADLPLWDLIKSGALPSQLTLTGVAITLRFDKEGHLLTRLPTSQRTVETVPAIQIDGGQITIRQEGHPDFVITGVHTELHEQNQQLALTGNVRDPTWGEWTVNGSLDRKTNAGSATLSTPDVHFTQERLEKLPFVPAKIWQQVKVEGDTAIDCAARYDPAAERAHYHITLEPRTTQVDVPSIQLHADHGCGKILIDDAIITLADLEGRAADGEIKTTGKLDFAQTPSQLDFKVDARNLDLDKLPKSWGLPQWGGRLNGHADLQVAVVNGKLQTNGSGEGVITGVHIPGAPESKPIRLKLHPSGEGFRFSSSSSESNVSLKAPPVSLALLSIALLAPQQPKKPQKAPSYVEAQLGLDDVDVAQLVKGLHIPLPFAISGRISFNVQLGVPLDTPRDFKTYRLRGTVHSRKLTIAEAELDELQVRVTYADGILRLEELSGHIPTAERAKAGAFKGTAQLGVIPQGDLVAHLVLDEIPLNRILALLPKAAEQAGGAFSGSVDLRVPAAKLKEIDVWEATGNITARRLELYGLALEDAAVLLRLHQGIASLQATRGRIQGTPITASAELRLADPYPFTGKLGLQKADLAALERLSPEVKLPVSIRGALSATADLKGTLNPLALETSGSGTAADLAIEQFKIGSLGLHWKGDLERIQITDVRAHLYDGELSGSAVLPLRASVAGRVQVRIQDLDVGAASKDVPNMPIRLEGRATGQLDGSLSAAAAGRPREFTSKLELQAAQLRVQGIPTERLHGSVDYRNESLTYRVEGETLGGKFHLNGQIPSEKSKPAESGPPQGHFRVEGVQLGRLVRLLGVRIPVRSIQGVLNLDATFRHLGPNGEPIGSGRFSLERVRWGETGLVGAVQGNIVLAEREFRVRDITGEFAQGVVRAQIAINLRQVHRSWFNLAMDQVEAAQLLAPWPELAQRVEGPLQIRLRGRFGYEWYGGGELALARGRVAGVEVLDWRLPFDWTLAPGRGGQVNFRESTAQVALGRVVSRASLTWGTGLGVEGTLRFFNLELRPFLRQMTELSQLGSGQVSGHFDFRGSDVRSINDLGGTLEARLQQTQALQLPVLQQLTPFLIPGQSSAAVFQTGSLRGRLGGGVFRIEQLSFAGTVLQLFVNGTVTLQERLNLEVTANTGNLGVNPAFVRFLGLRIPAVGPVPVSLLMEASTYFSNRVAHLRVTGTVRSPVITVEPLSLLTEEALRFFVNRANVPLP